MSYPAQVPSRRCRATLRALLGAAAVSLTLASSLTGQERPDSPPPRTALDGPRVGFTYLSSGIVDAARKQSINVSPVITQFGWQFERRLHGRDRGELQALSEVVLLVGGLDQGLVLPSASWMLGLRSEGGGESRRGSLGIGHSRQRADGVQHAAVTRPLLPRLLVTRLPEPRRAGRERPGPPRARWPRGPGSRTMSG